MTDRSPQRREEVKESGYSSATRTTTTSNEGVTLNEFDENGTDEELVEATEPHWHDHGCHLSLGVL